MGGLQNQKFSGGALADTAQAAGEDFQQSGNFSAALSVDMQAANRPDVGHRESGYHHHPLLKGKENTSENEQIVQHLLKDVNLTFTNNLNSSLMLNQHQDPVAAREKIDRALQVTGVALIFMDWAQKSADYMVDGKEKFLVEKREKEMFFIMRRAARAMGQTEMLLKALAEAAGID
ncbi:hypothetical protein RUND412_000605 [Rhizina undulata]